MNTGQMILQMPLGALLGSAMTANSPTTPSSAGEQQAGVFAGIMGELSAQAAATDLVADVAKSDVNDAPVTDGLDVAKDGAVNSTTAMPDLMASLLAAMGTPNQAAAVSAGNADEPHELTEEQPRVEVKMPQNVALNAAGAQAVPAQQVDGRMPASEQKPVEDVKNREQVVPVLARQQVQQNQHAASQDVFSLQQPISAEKVTVETPVEVQKPQEGVQGTARAAAVLESHLAGRMPASEQKPAEDVRSREQVVPVLARQQVQQNQHAASQDLFSNQQPTSAEKVSVTSAEVQKPQEGVQGTARAAAVLESHLDGRMPASDQKPADTGWEQEQMISALARQQSRVDVSLQAVTGPAKTTQAAAVAESQPVMAAMIGTAQEIAVQRQATTEPVAKPEAVDGVSPAQQDDLELPAGNMVAVPTITNKRPQYNQSGFKFARSTEVDVQLGNEQQVGNRIPDKIEGGLQNNLKVAVRQPEQPEAASGEASSSLTKEFVSTQQVAEPVRTITHPIPVAQQPVTPETTAAAPVQATQAETTRTEMHESIAGQVRERLAGHEVKSGSDQIVFRLSPENLGDIKVHLRMDDQRLKVEIVAENRLAREGLLQHVDSLKESLSRQNISMDKFSVTSGNSQAGGQWGGNNQGEWRELAKNRQAQQWLASGGYRMQADEVVPPVQQIYQATREHSMLDLHF